MNQVTSFDRAVMISRVLSKALESPLGDFRSVFERARQNYPEETAQFFISYVSRRGLDETSRKVLPWLCCEYAYLPHLVDPEFLSVEAASVALDAFRACDPQFASKFAEALSPDGRDKTLAALQRALTLLVRFSNYETFIPHLQALAKHSDAHISSSAVKALCKVRPNKLLVGRYLHSDDARVRANTLEALWHAKVEGVKSAFEESVNASDHRIALNAVIGLYYCGDSRAIELLKTLAEHSSVRFRRATVWALELLRDPKTKPILVKLSLDADDAIRVSAERALAKLPLEAAAVETLVEIPTLKTDVPAQPINVTAQLEPRSPAEDLPAESNPDPNAFVTPLFKLL